MILYTHSYEFPSHTKWMRVSGAHIMRFPFFKISSEIQPWLRETEIKISPLDLRGSELSGTSPCPFTCPTRVWPLPRDKEPAHQNPCFPWKEDLTEPARTGWGAEAVLVSCGCYKKLPHIRWLTTAQINYFLPCWIPKIWHEFHWGEVEVLAQQFSFRV